jgi:hypothetical protein
MTVEGAVTEITRRESWGSFLLWFGALASPTAWAIQLIVNYSLEEWFACAPSTQEAGRVLGMSVDAVALVVTTALVVLSLAGLLAAVRCFRRLKTVETESEERARWMALAGIFNGILYTIIIVASYGVPAVLETCRTTP